MPDAGQSRSRAARRADSYSGCMSFGPGAPTRSAPLPDAARCPCGSGDVYRGCCGPVIAGAPAATPEALMRSRYTAFAIGDLAHLAATWHPATRPDTLEESPGLRWTGLEVIDAVTSGARGTVEFRAHWREGADTGELHERSRFVRQSDRWWYFDGDVR